MLYIIDSKTGNCFNGNGDYINYIGGAQSVNMGYIKQIFLLSEKENLKISVSSEQDIFQIIDIESDSHEKLTSDKQDTINAFKYYDIQKHLCNVLDSRGISAKCSLPDSYIHCIYIYAQSPVVGTLIEDIKVSDLNGKTSYTIKIAGDFYDENEVEKINLENFGQEIPQQFVKAIYQTNVHDDAIDNIVLNRKRKELLCEYKNLEYQKGNYNSLLNYLSWFEYGDRLRLSEYWKVLDDSVEFRLQERDLQQMLSEKLKDVLDTEAKTTLIGIHCALEKLKTFESGHVRYDDGDSEKFSEISGSNGMFMARSTANFDPDITERAKLRDKETLQHFDQFEVHSSDETVPYGRHNGSWIDHNDNPETQNIPRTEPLDKGSNWLQNRPSGDLYFVPELLPELQSVTFKWSYEDMALKMRLLAEFYATYFMPIHLDLIQCSIESVAFYTIKMINWQTVKSETLYDNTNIPFSISTEKTIMLDCDTTKGMLEFENLNNTNDNLIAPFSYEFYRGIGALATVKTNISELIGGKYNITPKKLQVCVWLDGELQHESSRYYADNNDALNDIKVAFFKPGEHTVQVAIEDYSGIQLIDTQVVRVLDTTSHDISVKIIRRCSEEELNENEDKPNKFVDYLFSTYSGLEMANSSTIYTDFKNWNENSPGLTRVIKSYKTAEELGLEENKWYIYKADTTDGKTKYYYFSKEYQDKYEAYYKENKDYLEDKIWFIPMLNAYEDAKATDGLIRIPFGTMVALSSKYDTTTKDFADAYTLTNLSDNTVYTQQSIHEPIFGNLTPGRYSLTYKYSFGETVMTLTKSSIFLIEAAPNSNTL